MGYSYFDLLTEQQGLPSQPFDPLRELRLLRQKLALRIALSEQVMLEQVMSGHKRSEQSHSETVFSEFALSESALSAAESLEEIPPIFSPSSGSSTSASLSSDATYTHTHEDVYVSEPLESVALKSVAKKVDEIKKTLSIWQRSRALSPSSAPSLSLSALPVSLNDADVSSGTNGGGTTDSGMTDGSMTDGGHSAVTQQLVKQYLSESAAGTPQDHAWGTLSTILTALGFAGFIFGGLSYYHGGMAGLSLGSIMSLSGVGVVTIGLVGNWIASTESGA